MKWQTLVTRPKSIPNGWGIEEPKSLEEEDEVITSPVLPMKAENDFGNDLMDDIESKPRPEPRQEPENIPEIKPKQEMWDIADATASHTTKAGPESSEAVGTLGVGSSNGQGRLSSGPMATPFRGALKGNKHALELLEVEEVW